MIEPVSEPEKYVKRLSWKARSIKFVRRNFMYLPFVLFFIGLASLMLYYQDAIRHKLSWNVDISREISLDEYMLKSGKNNLASLQEKLAEESLTKGNRYEKFVSGKDVVNVSFGELLYSDELPPEPEPEVELVNTTMTVDTTTVDTVDFVEPEPKVIIRYVEKPQPPTPPVDTTRVDTVQLDTVQIDSVKEQPPVFFASLTHKGEEGTTYTAAYVYGDQEVSNGSLVRLRLAEDLNTEHGKVLEGTVFRGRARISDNIISIEINRISRFDVNYAVYDRDYSRGLILNKSSTEDINNALATSGYRSGNRSISDIPVDIAQDLTRTVLQNRRQKEQVKKLSDGDPIYIATNSQ